MTGALTDYGAVLSIPDGRRVLLADALSKSGDWLMYVAMSLLLFRSDGIWALGVLNLLRIAVPVLVGPRAGRWGQRWPARRVMVITDLVRCGALAAAAGAAATGLPLAVLLGTVALTGVASSVYGPAERRLQRDLIEPDRRAQFNAVLGSTGTLVLVVAPAFGGLVSALASPSWLLVVDAASFLLAAAIIARTRPTTVDAAAAASGGTGGAWRTALAVVSADRTVAACLLAQTGACFAVGASLVLLVPIADSVTGYDSSLGWLTAIIGIGSVVGAALGGTLASRKQVRAGLACIVVMGGAIGLLASGSALWYVVAVAALLGVVANLPEPLYWTVYAGRVPTDVSGVVYGLVDAAIVVALAGGGMLAGFLGTALGVTRTAWLLGAVTMLLAVAGLALYRTPEPVPAAT